MGYTVTHNGNKWVYKNVLQSCILWTIYRDVGRPRLQGEVSGSQFVNAAFMDRLDDTFA
jgi:hypothetical protein